ncbi:uncharacterized protein BDR25DRAFT_231806 [Lindgomyces ingoldianus]|uniref:Uncharacterized protein n=1 Tax=Lindgomyces ingoldianus TaxID=673940 RepID=A0ACB6QMZ3_9PLEO|nr:uncharacterized protein BDR25DRAFT_231806 [Lindgomyces ingoldianus]KAF2468318.1 hypothetical protein BDR25DRAFT_231806 [Lindgomyces ingoldianus]
MTYTVIALIYRKPGLTPAQFRTHYDTVHVPLLKSLVGDTFPITHTRNYVTRTRTRSDDMAPTSISSDSNNELWLPTLYRGQPSDFPYDSMTVMVWEDKTAFERFCEVFYHEEVQEKMQDDEEKFIDRRFRMVCALEEPIVTRRE